MKKILFVFLVLSCTPKESTYNYRYYRQIENDSLKNAIVNYVKATSVDVNSQFVAVYYNNYGTRTTYVISSGRNLQGIRLSPPDYFTIIGDILIAIRVTNRVVHLKESYDEFARFSQEKGLNFDADTLVSYDPPIWVLTECRGDYKLMQQIDPNYQDYLPCNYLLKRDLESDSLELVRK